MSELVLGSLLPSDEPYLILESSDNDAMAVGLRQSAALIALALPLTYLPGSAKLVLTLSPVGFKRWLLLLTGRWLAMDAISADRGFQTEISETIQLEGH